MREEQTKMDKMKNLLPWLDERITQDKYIAKDFRAITGYMIGVFDNIAASDKKVRYSAQDVQDLLELILEKGKDRYD